VNMSARRGRPLVLAAITATTAICLFCAPGLARAAAAPAQAIRPVPCRTATFNVHYGAGREKCYAGKGATAVHIPGVRLVTTGSNRGSFLVSEGTRKERIIFRPNERLLFPAGEHVEMVAIDIT
jgi:hypothetical protein